MKLKSILCLSAFCGLLSPLSLFGQEQSIALTTSKPVGTTLSISVNRIIEGFSIDWGDGVPVVYEKTPEFFRTVTGVTKSSELKVSSAGNITTFVCEDAGITELELKNAKQLRSLYVANNELETLSFSGLSEMVDIDISGNRLTKLTIPESTLKQLQNLNISNNEIERYNNYKRFRYGRASIEHLNISGNKFETLLTGPNTNLETLIASENLLTTIDVSSNPELSVFTCNDNAITELVFDEAAGLPKLKQFNCDNNSISSLVLNKSTKLLDLSCANNSMTELKLPAVVLSSMNCGGNALTFESLPISARKPQADFFIYKPQAGIDLISLGLLRQNEETGGYYMEQCPSYADRNNDQYKLSLARYRYDASGSATVNIDWYHMEAGEPVKMVRATAGQPNNDFTNSSGVYTFLKPFTEVYAELTHSSYPDLFIQTTHFAIGKENATAIQSIEAAETGTHEIFDLQGRRVSQPRHGMYIIDGKKVYVK